jgi:shikimate dehydrogenase
MSTQSLQPILALLGNPVEGNPTQYMLEQAFLHHGLEWRYLSLEIPPESLGDAVRGMRAMGFRGGNCAAPHQQAIGPLLDCLTHVAQASGTVTSIFRDDAKLVGDNTKGAAMLDALRRRIDPAGKRVVLLGAGRMARAIGVELAAAGVAEILVVNRSESSGQALVELLKAESVPSALWALWEGDYVVPPQTNVLIDATSLGPDAPDAPRPLVLDSLAPETIVADVTFNPARTWLLHEAASRGCPTIDGLELLIARTALDFHRWTAVEPDRTVLREAVEEFLEL